MRIINLLPKSRQQEFHYEMIFQSLLVFSILTLASFALVFVALFATRMYVSHEGSQIDSQTDQVKNVANKQENAQLRNKVKGINVTINDFQKLADATPKWSKVLAAFIRLVPSGIQINSFSADLKANKVQVLGFSPTRDSVIELYNNISADDKNFSDVDYPLENVSKPENISFHYTFTIKDELLK